MTKIIQSTIKNCSTCQHNTLNDLCMLKYNCNKYTPKGHFDSPLIYVIGDNNDTKYQELITQRAANAGVLPINARLYFATFAEQKQMLEELDDKLLQKCEAVWIFGAGEYETLVKHALMRGKPIYFIDQERVLPDNDIINNIISDIKFAHQKNKEKLTVRLACLQENDNEMCRIEYYQETPGKKPNLIQRVSKTGAYPLHELTTPERTFLSYYVKHQLDCGEIIQTNNL